METSTLAQMSRLKTLLADRGFSLPLAPPATLAEIEAVERETGLRLSDDLREFYLLSNGSARSNWLMISIENYIMPLEMQSLADCLDWWRQSTPVQEPTEPGRDARIRPEYWVHRRWFPCAGFSPFPTTVYLDDDPTVQGTRGQIIVYEHDPDAFYWQASSFHELLQKSNDTMEKHWDELSEELSENNGELIFSMVEY